MRGELVILGLLVILIALILRMRTKYQSERIQTIGFVIIGISFVVVGLILN